MQHKDPNELLNDFKDNVIPQFVEGLNLRISESEKKLLIEYIKDVADEVGDPEDNFDITVMRLRQVKEYASIIEQALPLFKKLNEDCIAASEARPPKISAVSQTPPTPSGLSSALTATSPSASLRATRSFSSFFVSESKNSKEELLKKSLQIAGVPSPDAPANRSFCLEMARILKPVDGKDRNQNAGALEKTFKESGKDHNQIAEALDRVFKRYNNNVSSNYATAATLFYAVQELSIKAPADKAQLIKAIENLDLAPKGQRPAL